MFDAVLLAALAVILAGPAPLSLARARWTAEYPVAALVLWQAVGLTGGLALLTSELALAVADQGGRRPSALRAVIADPGRLTATGWLGVALFVLTACWLVGVLFASTARVVAGRRAHRERLDLLACTLLEPARPPVYLLAHPAAAAYSLPGLRSRIVVSQGARDRLSARQLGAVLAHERAHLRQHHDVVVQPFVAWRNSFPRLRTAALALSSVERLTEYLADDAAVARHGTEPVLTALARMAPGNPGLLDRQRRLERREGTVPYCAGLVALLAFVTALVMVAGPPLALAALA